MGDCRRTIRGMFKGMDGFFAWFGLVLRQARRDADMSQRELARWSAVPKSVIADAESGRATNLYVATQLLMRWGTRWRFGTARATTSRNCSPTSGGIETGDGSRRIWMCGSSAMRS